MKRNNCSNRLWEKFVTKKEKTGKEEKEKQCLSRLWKTR